MSKIKNGGLDQYGAESFEQQQFGTAGVEGVKAQTIESLRFLFRSQCITGRPHDIATVRMTADELTTITHKIQRLHVLRNQQNSQYQ